MAGSVQPAGPAPQMRQHSGHGRLGVGRLGRGHRPHHVLRRQVRQGQPAEHLFAGQVPFLWAAAQDQSQELRPSGQVAAPGPVAVALLGLGCRLHGPLGREPVLGQLHQ
jgi:hypothetical protein